jgi:hypothetical protein
MYVRTYTICSFVYVRVYMQYGVLFLSNGWGAFCSEMITSDSWSITGEGKRLLIVGSSQTRIGQKMPDKK